MKLTANTQTGEVIGLEEYYVGAKLHFSDDKNAVIKVSGKSYFNGGMPGYEYARMIVCRVTGLKGSTVELEWVFEFPTRSSIKEARPVPSIALVKPLENR